MSKRLALGLLFAILVLGWLLQWFLGNLFYDILWSWLGAHGIHEAKLVAFISQNIIPFLLASLVISGVYFFVRFELQRSLYNSGPSPDVLGGRAASGAQEMLPAPNDFDRTSTSRAFERFREEKTLQFLRGAPLKLDVGESGEFFETTGRFNLYTHQRTLKVRVSNVDRSRSLAGCRVQIINISPHEYDGPWILKDDFTLAAGDHEFIPLVEYTEPDAPPKSHSGRSTFMEILTTKNRPKPSTAVPQILTIRATAHDTPYCDLKCKIWTDDSGTLRIEQEHEGPNPRPVDDKLPFQDAAQISYERAEKDGWLDTVAGESTDPQQRLETFKYMMLVQAQHHAVVLCGVKPPSRQSFPIPQEKLGGLRPVAGESALHSLSPDKAVYHSVTISRTDLEKVIAVYQAIATNMGGSGEPEEDGGP